MSEKMSDGLVGMEVPIVEGTKEEKVITIRNYLFPNGKLTLTYKTITRKFDEPYKTAIGDKKFETYVLELVCNSEVVFNKNFPDLIEASNAFNALYKTVSPNA